MSSLAGNLIAAIGTKMASAFPGYSIVYGQETPGIDGPNKSVRIHYIQERGVFAASQVGGPVRVSPAILVTAKRPYSGNGSSLADHQATLDLSADLRNAIEALVMDHITGVAQIQAFAGQALWITDYLATPGLLFLGSQNSGSTESVTHQFSFEFSNTYGGR